MTRCPHNAYRMKKTLLEICAGDIASVTAAAAGGADRVELCSALSEGGVTPSAGFIAAACAVGGVRKHVLVRPRGGDFLYTEAEKAVMLADVARCRDAGADGVVVGALQPDGTVDLPFLCRLVEAAGGMSVTFHRAFDLCSDPMFALLVVAGAGCKRVLTSGQAATAEEGLPLLRSLVEAGRKMGVSVMPGCGVTPENARRIVDATGAEEIHASARAAVASGMTFRRGGVGMGLPGTDEYSRKETSPAVVRAIVDALRG